LKKNTHLLKKLIFYSIKNTTLKEKELENTTRAYARIQH